MYHREYSAAAERLQEVQRIMKKHNASSADESTGDESAIQVDSGGPRSSPPSSGAPTSNEDLEAILRRAIKGSSGGRLENINWSPDDRSLDLDSWILQVEQSFRVHAPDKTPAQQTDWAILQLRGRAARWWSAMGNTGLRDTIFESPNVQAFWYKTGPVIRIATPSSE